MRGDQVQAREGEERDGEDPHSQPGRGGGDVAWDVRCEVHSDDARTRMITCMPSITYINARHAHAQLSCLFPLVYAMLSRT